MDDRATIEIDCLRDTVRVDCCELGALGLRQIETTKASLIVDLLMPTIAELMKLSKEELMRRNLSKQAGTHPVDALKAFAPDIDPKVEKQLRDYCDQPMDISFGKLVQSGGRAFILIECLPAEDAAVILDRIRACVKVLHGVPSKELERWAAARKEPFDALADEEPL